MTAYTGQEQIEKRIRKLLQGILLSFVESLCHISDDLGIVVDPSWADLDRSWILSIA